MLDDCQPCSNTLVHRKSLKSLKTISSSTSSTFDIMLHACSSLSEEVEHDSQRGRSLERPLLRGSIRDQPAQRL